MAQIKSAEKRNRQKDRRRARNRLVLGAMRSALKRARAAVAAGDRKNAIIKEAVKKLDSAASKGVIKKQTASRLISRLTSTR
jgi:small subunit ribosomal protein S20